MEEKDLDFLMRFKGQDMFIYHCGDPFLRDVNGYVLNRTEINDFLDKIHDFYETYTNEDIDEINSKVDQIRGSKNIYTESKNEQKEFNENEYVYFIKNEDNVVKIGRTINLTNRISALKGASPHELKLMNYIQTHDCVELEEMAHKYFSDKKIRGEWFDVNQNDVKEFAKKHHLKLRAKE